MSADYASATIEWGANTLTLLELVKQLLDVADNSQDVELSMYLDMAGSACEDYCDNKLVQQDVTEQYAMAQYPIALRYWITGAISDVTIDGLDETASWKTYSSDGVTWATPITTGDYLAGSFKQLSITYSAGFEPVPSDVGYAIASVAIAYQQSGGSTVGSVKKESIVGVGSVEYVTDTEVNGNVGLLSPSILGVLNKYKRYHV